MLAAACRAPAPHVSFTEVPPAGMGGPIRTAKIAGRVDGARPGDRVVLFAKSGLWYVQPLKLNPFTEIDAQGAWRSTVHLGSEYAALVVSDDYRPPATATTLPEIGAGVRTVATVAGSGRSPDASAPPLPFSGYEWDVREHPSDRGGGNQYAAANARVEADGALRLTLARRDGQWTSAGACLTRALGYGTYVFVTRDMAHVDPAARLALFTYDANGRADHFREMNIDLWRGDGPPTVSGQFVLQPNYLPGNVHRFSIPAERVSHTLRWEPGVVTFRSLRGDFLAGASAALASQSFTIGVPAPGDERICVALYYYQKSPRAPRADTDVVIERFQYLP